MNFVAGHSQDSAVWKREEKAQDKLLGHASYCFSRTMEKKNKKQSQEHSGGGLMDFATFQFTMHPGAERL